MNHPTPPEQRAAGSTRAYVVGFGLSLAVTLAAYALTKAGRLHGWTLLYALSALAVTQLLVQLVCFLHLGRESKPRWNLTVLLFAALVVFILVFGSLWIMRDLSYGHHPQDQPDQRIIQDEGYRP